MILAIGFAAACSAEVSQPNVVLFFVDDMGWSDWQRSALNPEGSDVYETPNLLRLAQSGVVFDNGYASAPVCTPTRVSLMTGSSAGRHRTTDFIGAGSPGVRGVLPPSDWSQELDASEVTLPEALRDGGYQTGFFGKWHLGSQGTPAADPLANGYGTNVAGRNYGNPGPAGGFFAGSDGAWAGLPGLDTPGSFASDAYLSDAIADRAADFVSSSVSQGDPFFLTLSHYLVHTPIQAPADLVTKYNNKISGMLGRGEDVGGHDNATYAAMVEKLDQSIGQVLDRLQDPNGDQDQSDSVLDSTVVIFTSDNGGLTSFNVTDNRPLREGKGSIYEGGIREPYIVSWTGSSDVGSGVINSTPVVTHDLYPTLLELTGVAGDTAQESRTDGVSFAGALAGQTLQRKPIVWHYPHVSPQDGGDNNNGIDGGQFVSAIRSDNWKLIWFHEQARYELYNLSTDPGEASNVAAANPAVSLELSDKLRRNLIDSDALMPEVVFGSAGRRSLEPPPLAVFEVPLPLDDFSSSHDFRADGVASTVWDGVELGASTVLRSQAGELQINSTGTNLIPEAFNAPLLYEEVVGDFDARLDLGSMTSANFHVLAIIAQDVDGDSVWVGQQDRDGEGDFAQSRSHAGAAREDQTLAGQFEHFRLVREGSNLRGYVSEDGLFWRQFAQYDRPDLPATLKVGITQASFGRGSVSATVDSFTIRPYGDLYGDFNGDGTVDSADYVVWRDGLGERYTQSDYGVWRLNYGQSVAAMSRTDAVPEPTSMVGVGVVLLTLTGWRTRGRQEVSQRTPGSSNQVSRPAIARLATTNRTRLMAVLAIALSAMPAVAIDISRAPSNQRQQFEAWGTSLAWWANGVGGWTDTLARSDLVEAMFDQSNGLGLNYARYNIGGGQNRLYSSNFRPGALVNGWVPSAPSDVNDPATWNWNWQADATQRGVLDEVLQLGVTRVDAISYSAPFWMTVSQDSAGNVGGAPNLPTSNYNALAHYQAEVVQHFHDNLDVRFQAFSPLNEPDVNWWVAGGRQEGMVVPDGAAQRDVLQAVGQEFASRGLPIGLAGTEETNTSKAANSWQQLNTATKDYISHLHTHTYGGNSTANLNQVRSLAAADGKKLYMSEYGNNSSSGLLGGVALANRITQDINEMGVNGWAYWQVVEPTSLSGAGWGLAWAGYGAADSGHTIRKQYHVMRQFTHGVRPGATILDTTDANTVAAYDPVVNATVLVVSNSSEAVEARAYSLTDGAPQFTRVIRTSNTEDFASLGRWDSSSDFSVNSPGPSVTTLVLHHQPNLISNPHLDGSNGSAVELSGGWKANGTATFLSAAGPNDPSTGSAAIPAVSSSGAGAIWQEALGDANVDITGQAFQLSVDVRFKEQQQTNFDAEATIGFEFYGADGQTLAHSTTGDFSTRLDPVADDTQWRTFRTPSVVAPAGARFVRPIVRVDEVGAGSTGELRVDNFYAQEIRYVPRGRHWVAGGSGSTGIDDNWEFDASRDEHDSWYFGPQIEQPSTISMSDSEVVSRLTFDSDQLYRVAGAGLLRLSADSSSETAIVDTRSGSHSIQAAITLESDTAFQMVGDTTTLTISGPVDAAGFKISARGAGSLSFTGDLSLDGGELEVYARQVATVNVGSQATLDGVLRVLLEPGVNPSLGNAFELVTFNGGVNSFDAVHLPELSLGLAWNLDYEASSLVASVVAMLEGDYNNDGVVDAADYTVWRSAVGAPAGTLPNDPSGVAIGPSQYEAWKANYGATLASSAAIPEPTAILIVAIGSVPLLLIRHL